MLTATLTNIATEDVLDLNEILEDGQEGLQVIAGAIGFGLPQVDIQWAEGAGDGAIYRGSRALPRDIDLNLYAAKPTRAELVALVQNFATVTSGPMVLTVSDAELGIEWLLNVVRSSGGAYTYGEDTTGETDWQTILTLRAGDPFWHRGTSENVDETDATVDDDERDITYRLTTTVAGSAPAAPIYTLHGPFTSFTIIVGVVGEAAPPESSERRRGRTLSWSGNVKVGESLTVDCGNATIVDGSGRNRYDGLLPAPSFTALAPGENKILIELAIDEPVVSRTNWYTNPRFGNSTHGWTVDDGSAGDMAVIDGVLTLGDPENSPLNVDPLSAHIEVAGFSADAGMIYNLLCKVGSPTFPRLAGEWAGTLFLTVEPDVPGQERWFPPVAVPILTTTDGASQDVAVRFAAPASGSVTLRLSQREITEGGLADGRGGLGNQRTRALLIDNIYIGREGSYFDGATTDTANYTYSWTGTADASTSLEEVGSPSTPTFDIEWTPRDWLVI